MSLSRCRVVLVRPHYAGNVGSVARVLANFGLNQLVLVDPVAKIDSLDAIMMSTHGRSLLQSARIVNTLDEALADCAFVLSTSGEVKGLARRGFWGTPEQKLPQLLDTLPVAECALVFGPEPHGLTLEEITRGHGMIFIPTAGEHESLNLAQAVAVVLYQLHTLWLKREPSAPILEDIPATYESQERMFEQFKEALTDIRFLWDFRSDGIFHVIRTVISRSQPTQKELQIFHALAKQLMFITREFGVPHPSAVPKLGEWRSSPDGHGPAATE
jgi:tRNA/rRNA methyltransferase